MTESAMTGAREPVHAGVSSAVLVARAAAGDEQAWGLLVERHTSLLWVTARAYARSDTDAAEAVHIAWLRLAEHLRDLPDPDRVGVWLVSAVRRECFRRLPQPRRAQVADAVPDIHDRADIADGVDGDRDVDTQTRHTQPRAALRHALRLLPPRQRLLLRLLSSVPTATQEEVSAALNMPVSSIGPTRAQALQRLREILGTTRAAP